MPSEGEAVKLRAYSKHGHTSNGTETPTWISWQCMLARCRYLHRDTQKKHIGRGITVCDRWLSFSAFLKDMGERPDGTTLDRKNNELGYFPDNCKWATPIEQARNRRNAKLDYKSAMAVAMRMLKGERAVDIARELGISESLPREIIKGRSWKDARDAALAEFNG